MTKNGSVPCLASEKFLMALEKNSRVYIYFKIVHIDKTEFSIALVLIVLVMFIKIICILYKQFVELYQKLAH